MLPLPLEAKPELIFRRLTARAHAAVAPSAATSGSIEGVQQHRRIAGADAGNSGSDVQHDGIAAYLYHLKSYNTLQLIQLQIF